MNLHKVDMNRDQHKNILCQTCDIVDRKLNEHFQNLEVVVALVARMRMLPTFPSPLVLRLPLVLEVTAHQAVVDLAEARTGEDATSMSNDLPNLISQNPIQYRLRRRILVHV